MDFVFLVLQILLEALTLNKYSMFAIALGVIGIVLLLMGYNLISALVIIAAVLLYIFAR